jgi:hypothetical protein
MRKLKPEGPRQYWDWIEPSATRQTAVVHDGAEEQWSGLYDSAGRKLVVAREPIGFVHPDREK